MKLFFINHSGIGWHVHAIVRAETRLAADKLLRETDAEDAEFADEDQDILELSTDGEAAVLWVTEWSSDE